MRRGEVSRLRRAKELSKQVALARPGAQQPVKQGDLAPVVIGCALMDGFPEVRQALLPALLPRAVGATPADRTGPVHGRKQHFTAGRNALNDQRAGHELQADVRMQLCQCRLQPPQAAGEIERGVQANRAASCVAMTQQGVEIRPGSSARQEVRTDERPCKVCRPVKPALGEFLLDPGH